MRSLEVMTRSVARLLSALLVSLTAIGAPAPEVLPKSESAKPEEGGNPALAAALERLKLPGVTINLEERCVDVESTVALLEGSLEFVACTRDTKEHESILIVEAKPSHIHTALLLLGAKPGHPAMRKPIDEEGLRFIDLPPRGGPVDVSLVVQDDGGKERERPISAFLERSEDFEGAGFDDEEEDAKFPTNTWVFAGSILHGQGDGPRTYIADQSGSVISLSTFGDELLCLPGVHGHANGALMWQVNSEHLPRPGKTVILRLRPQLPAQAAPKK